MTEFTDVEKILDLSVELEERQLAITIQHGFDAWVVWLFPQDDPSLMVVQSSDDLRDAIRLALDAWDSSHAKAERPS